MSQSMTWRSFRFLLIVGKDGSMPTFTLPALAARIGTIERMSSMNLIFKGTPQRISRLGFPLSFDRDGGPFKAEEKSSAPDVLLNDFSNNGRIVLLHFDALASLTNSCKDEMHSAGKELNTFSAGLPRSNCLDSPPSSGLSCKAL